MTMKRRADDEKIGVGRVIQEDFSELPEEDPQHETAKMLPMFQKHLSTNPVKARASLRIAFCVVISLVCIFLLLFLASETVFQWGVWRDVSVPTSEIYDYVPKLHFHTAEKFWPIDPLLFVEKSRLCVNSSFCWNIELNNWSKDAHSKNVSVGLLNSFKAVNGKNRRPQDSNRNKDLETVFLCTDTLIHSNTETANILWDRIPMFFTVREKMVGPSSHNNFLGKKMRIIQFWWFLGFNPGRSVLKIGEHQGDWEHIAVLFEGHLFLGGAFQPILLSYAAHEGGNQISTDKLPTKSHWDVYVSKDSHGSYSDVGKHKMQVPFLYDKTSAKGIEWFPDIDQVKDVAKQPWRDFAGAWGKAGSKSYTTGPLGPWYKRMSEEKLFEKKKLGDE